MTEWIGGPAEWLVGGSEIALVSSPGTIDAKRSLFSSPPKNLRGKENQPRNAQQLPPSLTSTPLSELKGSKKSIASDARRDARMDKARQKAKFISKSNVHMSQKPAKKAKLPEVCQLPRFGTVADVANSSPEKPENCEQKQNRKRQTLTGSPSNFVSLSNARDTSEPPPQKSRRELLEMQLREQQELYEELMLKQWKKKRASPAVEPRLAIAEGEPVGPTVSTVIASLAAPAAPTTDTSSAANSTTTTLITAPTASVRQQKTKTVKPVKPVKPGKVCKGKGQALAATLVVEKKTFCKPPSVKNLSAGMCRPKTFNTFEKQQAWDKMRNARLEEKKRKQESKLFKPSINQNSVKLASQLLQKQGTWKAALDKKREKRKQMQKKTASMESTFTPHLGSNSGRTAHLAALYRKKRKEAIELARKSEIGSAAAQATGPAVKKPKSELTSDLHFESIVRAGRQKQRIEEKKQLSAQNSER